MSRTIAPSLAILMVAALAACAPRRAQAQAESPPPAEGPPSAPDATATDPVLTELLKRHNRERAEAKLPPLALHPKLTAAAAVHARDMAAHGKMSHEGSDGSKAADRIKRQGYHYRRVGENVAYGQPSAEAVMRGWMNSPHHKENILGDFKEMGAARVKDDEKTPYWCVTFGLPWPRPDPAQVVSALVEELNGRRAGAELPPLETDPTLAVPAQHHARVMAEQGRMVAQDDEGLTPYDRIKADGSRFQELAQSMAFGQPDAPAAVKTLMDNADLKATALGNYTHIGVGYARDKKEIPYWCILYGRAPAP